MENSHHRPEKKQSRIYGRMKQCQERWVRNRAIYPAIQEKILGHEWKPQKVNYWQNTFAGFPCPVKQITFILWYITPCTVAILACNCCCTSGDMQSWALKLFSKCKWEENKLKSLETEQHLNLYQLDSRIYKTSLKYMIIEQFLLILLVGLFCS